MNGCGRARIAIVTPRVALRGIAPNACAALSHLTTETFTRYPSKARMRIGKSLDTCSRSSFRIEVIRVREVPARRAIFACVILTARDFLQARQQGVLKLPFLSTPFRNYALVSGACQVGTGFSLASACTVERSSTGL
jgi:hypothetical protein